MNCGDIHEISPLWHSGELAAGARAEFESHVSQCVDCAAELAAQQRTDVLLREAIEAHASDDAVTSRELGRRVMGQIAQENRRRWLFPALATAAAVLLAAGTAFVVKSRSVAAAPVIFADAARDHTLEVVNKATRRWRVSVADIATIETSQGVSDHEVKAIEATGYKLQRAKICRLGGKAYIHLVYAKDGREVSVYLRSRGDQKADGNDAASSTAGNLHLASFAQGQVQAVIVSDAPGADCEKFAKAAQAAL